MLYVNFQWVDDAEISEGTMGRNNCKLGPMLSSSSSVLSVEGNKIRPQNYLIQLILDT